MRDCIMKLSFLHYYKIHFTQRNLHFILHNRTSSCIHSLELHWYELISTRHGQLNDFPSQCPSNHDVK